VNNGVVIAVPHLQALVASNSTFSPFTAVAIRDSEQLHVVWTQPVLGYLAH
jgi:hypothetical protein